ncbi:MAG TPA: N-acetylneuraminate synthase family protein [Niabella sp.]
MKSLFDTDKPLFVSEISSNHNGDMTRCKELIHATSEANCDGVKFQLFKINELFSKEALAYNKKLSERVQWELKEEFLPELAAYAHKKNLLFSCTPFYLSAVDTLEPYVDFYKIASYELLWKDLFKVCANTGKPLVFSIGMSTENEVRQVLDDLADTALKEILVLHCNSSYPTPLQDVNLSVIGRLRSLFSNYYPDKKIEFGWSDHTVNQAVVLGSVLKYDSRMVEFHIDLDGKGYEYEAGHCWLPDQIKQVIDQLSEIRLAEGYSDIKASNSELIEREWRADPADGLRPLRKTRESLQVKL